MRKADRLTQYRQFLESKRTFAKRVGFDIPEHEIHPMLKRHQNICVRWLAHGGRRALFASFGLGKTFMQLETLRLILSRKSGRGLIVAPLGVRGEFIRDAAKLGIPIRFVRSVAECGETGVYITNYETVREGKIDPSQFTVTTLDEAAILRGFGGTKTFREFMRLFDSVEYRFVATATPDPNEYIELLAYSAYLGIMDVGEAKTRFFKRDATKADVLTLLPHKEEEFWLWIASWALFLQKPSDIGCDDTGYDLPEMRVCYHEVDDSVIDRPAAVESNGQVRMWRDAALGAVGAAKEKRDSLPMRVAKLKQIVDESPGDHFLIWHHLEDERRAIQSAIPAVNSVFGNQDLEERERLVSAFSEGEIQYLSTKPVLAGSGCNFQRFCHKAIFAGIDFKFNDFFQAIHRIHRFLQDKPVEIHIIYAESEQSVLKRLKEKWERHTKQVERMSQIIRQYELNDLALAQVLVRSIGVKRVEASGQNYRCVNSDCVEETMRMEPNSVGLILSSIPFSTQYEYTPSYNDFGHTESNDHFFAQMDFLTPELFRVLQPGRIAAIHVKPRVVPGGINGLGFQTVYRFHHKVADHFESHGFAYLGEKTIITDVVRENNQTYRLGWTEQCKDGSKMGYGVPEYLLLFRKPQTDTSKGYADIPVRKDKKRYSKARWQVDAHGFTRSDGDRPLTPEEIAALPVSKDFHQKVFGMFHDFYLRHVYNFENHVKIGEELERRGLLPVTFMLLQPPSWHPDVWTDITRMLTANVFQAGKGKQKHLCPMQFDIADRVITQMSNPGDVVYDPFGGLMTVPARAVALGRFGLGVELNPGYWADGVAYCEAAEKKIGHPSLLDCLSADAEAVA